MTARPTRRSGSRNAQFQRRVPANVLKVARGHRVALALPPQTLGDAPIHMTVTLGDTLRFSLRTEDKALREMRHAAVVQQLESAFAAILKAQQDGPRTLSDKECHALAGIIYRAFADGLENNPISTELWAHVQAENDFAINGPLPGWSIADSPEEQARIERIGMLNRRFGPFVDAILLREGVICDQQSRNKLLSAFARAMNEAAVKLQKNAEGDYSPDPVATRFPKWDTDKQSKKANTDRRQTSGSTLTQLFQRWQGHSDQKTITPSTIASYSAVFEKFRAFIVKRHGTEPEAAQLNRDDFRAFIDMRSNEDGVSAKTINGVDLAAINSVLNWAVEQDIITENPAIRVKRKVRKGTEPGSRKRKTLNDAEARAILKCALEAPLASTREDPKLVAAKRWVPWLMAYTGTRVGEVAQLRKSDVVKFDGHWAIAVSMDAGTVKTKSTWHVPLHPHLIEQGFIAYVEGAADGHLFLTPRPDLYRSDAKASRTKDPRGILGPLQGLKNKLAAFAKAAMPNADGPAPNHGWRHRFKAKAREYGIDQEVRNAFADHASADVAGDYGKDELYAAMVAALSKIRRYEVE
jgi:integrase